MDIIETPSFKLAVNAKGNESSDKLAVIIPGRLDTKDYASCVSHIEYLAGIGFYAISFDPPGTWESPGGIELFTTTNYIKAVNELIEHFSNKQAFLLGHSRGGAVAALVGNDNPAVAGLAIAMGSYGDPTPPSPEEVKAGFKISYRDLPPGNVKTEQKKQFELPVNYFEDGAKYDPLGALKRCAKPKLLVYGIKDEFTSLTQVKEVYKVIPDPKMIYELDSVHDYRYQPEAVEEINHVVGEFLDRYDI